MAASLGCSPAPLPSPGPEQLVDNNGDETSAGFAPASVGEAAGIPVAFPATAVSSFNEFTRPAGGGIFGYAWTVDGINWTSCNADQSGPCFVPKHPSQKNWRGDPAIAAAPQGGGIVVAANLANTTDDSGNPNMIVAALSFDGGRSYGNTQWVNGDGCTDGDQDQEAIAFDPTTTEPTVWIAWRHNGAAGLSGTYGICVRGGTVNAAAHTIDWFGPSEEMQNLDRAPFHGAGGLLIQPAHDAVTVMYSNTDRADTSIFCSTHDTQVKWFTGTTTDAGASWSSSHLVYDTQTFHWCTSGLHYQNGLRAFGFVRDSYGDLWAAVHDSPGTIRTFTSTDEGTTWIANRVISVIGFPDLLFPTLAAGAGGRVGLTFYGSESAERTMRMFFTAKGYDPAQPQRWSFPLAYGNVFLASGLLSRSLGDYLGMTVVPSGSFHFGDDETFLPLYTDGGGAGFQVSSALIDMPGTL